MSSLIFHTDESQILVATDTLAVNENGEPFMFTMKAIYIPYLRTIVAGTGVGGFSNEWGLKVVTRMVLDGIENLNYHTPIGLRELWFKYTKEYSLPESFTTTVYQFGISEITNKVVSFAYRSSSNFVSEQLQYGKGIKPECNIPEGDFIKSIPLMMQEQRDIQEQQPKESRLYIGGEIFVLYLTPKGCNSFKLGQFPDFELHKRAILDKYSKEQH